MKENPDVENAMHNVAHEVQKIPMLEMGMQNLGRDMQVVVHLDMQVKKNCTGNAKHAKGPKFDIGVG